MQGKKKKLQMKIKMHRVTEVKQDWKEKTLTLQIVQRFTNINEYNTPSKLGVNKHVMYREMS